MKPPPNRVLELHVFNPSDGTTPVVESRHLRTIKGFLDQYFRFENGPPRINRKKGYIGVVHDSGVYMIEAITGTLAMGYADQVDPTDIYHPRDGKDDQWDDGSAVSP